MSRHYCSDCDSHFYFETVTPPLIDLEQTHYRVMRISYAVCPSCNNPIVSAEVGVSFGDGFALQGILFAGLAPPTKRTAPKEVPLPVASDYNEAVAVLSVSAKASAALSRRCLQHVLRERGYKHHDLVRQVEAVLGEADSSKSVPETLRVALDAVRNFGNFSAHPLTDKTSLQVVDVEPGEAEWCLEILEECFESFYVRPARLAERKMALNEKLASVGKPPAK